MWLVNIDNLHSELGIWEKSGKQRDTGEKDNRPQRPVYLALTLNLILLK